MCPSRWSTKLLWLHLIKALDHANDDSCRDRGQARSQKARFTTSTEASNTTAGPPATLTIARTWQLWGFIWQPSHASGSSPQLPVQPPGTNQAAQDSYASPKALASVLTGSSKDSACYLKSLQMQQRCTVTGVHCVLQLPLLMKILLDSCMWLCALGWLAACCTCRWGLALWTNVVVVVDTLWACFVCTAFILQAICWSSPTALRLSVLLRQDATSDYCCQRYNMISAADLCIWYWWHACICHLFMTTAVHAHERTAQRCL